MITLNDYLYAGDPVPRILHKYSYALRRDALTTNSRIDMMHSNFLQQLGDILEHNEFLTSQSQRIREFYKYMAAEYPDLAFTFKGRIKSLIRAEEKFNGYIVEYVADYYKKYHIAPTAEEIRSNMNRLRDLVAYRIIIQMPTCNLKEWEDRKTVEECLLYDIANTLPGFLKERGFKPEVSPMGGEGCSSLLHESARPYYRDNVATPRKSGYQSLHITFYDTVAHCYTEVQLRTKQMDDFAEIGGGNHQGYEEAQAAQRAGKALVPPGLCPFYDEALERGRMLTELDLTQVDVSMFTAYSRTLMNDGCGLYRGRLITPCEHLSRFQNDKID